MLEAIYCLGTGRSFRTNRSKLLIQNGFDKLNLFAKFHQECGKEHQLGLEKEEGNKRYRLDRAEIKKASEIAKVFPIQTFTPDSHSLLNTGPHARRRFLDWGLFHVEPDYLAVWQKYRKTLSQRNAALRNQQPKKSIVIWDEPLTLLGERLSELRNQYCHQILSHLAQCLELFDIPYDVKIEYHPGWVKGLTLAQALEKKYDFDLSRGITSCGPHRAELRLTIDNLPVSSFLSRGESKALAFSLQFCQMKVSAQITAETPVVVWDDIEAEFDETRMNAFLQLLGTINCQAFLTSVHFKGVTPSFVTDYKWFHVERGNLQEMV